MPYAQSALTVSPPLPETLALVDDDATYSEYLTQFLRGKGVAVTWFPDSDDLLSDPRAFQFHFYIADLMLPGIDGLSMLRLLRKRTDAGMLVVSGKLASNVFDEVICAGADMLLAKPASFEQIAVAVAAVYRRSGRPGAAQPAWRLDVVHRRLMAPDGAVIELSPTDASVLECLLHARGSTVSRDTLSDILGTSPLSDPNLLHATIYRLRRRIERATPAMVPLQVKSRVGYVFRAPLEQA